MDSAAPPDGENSYRRILPELLLLSALSLYLNTFALTQMDLWPSHEARAAMDAQSILESGDWLLPRLYDGTPELQKPPGFYWLVAGVAELRGVPVDALCVRLPSVLAALFTVLVTHLFVRRFVARRTGFLIGLILLSSHHWITSARTGRIDMPLTAAVTGTIVLSTWNVSGVRRVLKWIGLCFGLAAALMLKGLIGWLMILGIWFVAWLLRKRHRLPTPDFLGIFLSAIASLTLITPWFWIVNERTGGQLFESLIVYHHFRRAFGGSDLAGHPFWFYVPRLLFDFLPWSIFGVCGLACYLLSLWKHGLKPVPQRTPVGVRASARASELAPFSAVAFAVIFLGLSASRFKRADYLLPLYPWLAILTGLAIRHSFLKCCERAILLLFPLFLLAFPLIADRYQTRYDEPYRVEQFAAAVRADYPIPSQIVLFRTEAHQLSWHLSKPIQTILEWHDLRSALGSGGHFLTRAELLDECRQTLDDYDLTVSRDGADFCAVTPHRRYVWLKAAKR